MRTLDNSVNLRVIEKSKPVIAFDFSFRIFGWEWNSGFNSAIDTSYHVVDEENNSYFIGNSPEECHMWIEDNQC